MRLNDDGSVPTDNPFFAQGGNLAKYYAYGIRNSFGLAFDPITGALWSTENGPNNYDEINRVLPGFNSGWERIMGPVSRDQEGLLDLVFFPGSHYADPKFSWFDTVGPTAIVFLDSPRLAPDYQNDLFAGDINNGILYRFRMNQASDGFVFGNPNLTDLVADNNSTEIQEVVLGTGFITAAGGITDLKVGPDGLLYLLAFGLGKIFVIYGAASPVDFDGDVKSDIGVYRDGAWFIRRSSDGGITSLGWGGAVQDVPVPADYDGDGRTDLAVYRNGAWFILRSSDSVPIAIGWGIAGDVAVPADYDGDGRTDLAVYRNGAWFILRSSDSVPIAAGWGVAGDVAVPADYDGDGRTDLAVYRNGAWFILRSSDSVPIAAGWGVEGDVAVPADYDGDGRTDLAVYRDGGWFIFRSSDSVPIAVGWGVAGDVAVPADYDGDGKADLAVYRDGGWFISRSSDSVPIAIGWGGAAQDIPLN